jgi:hypothetical protein
VTLLAFASLQVGAEPNTSASTPTSATTTTTSSTTTTSTAANSTLPNGLTLTEKNALTIDSALFDASVPSYAYVGENFSVKMRVINHSNETLPIILGVSAPVDVLYVSPLLVHKDIPPGGALTQTFWVVAIQPNGAGRTTMTGKVWIWFYDRMDTPALVSQTTAQVFGIRPSPLVGTEVAVAVVVIAVAAGSVLLWRRRRLLGSRLTPDTGRSLSRESDPLGAGPPSKPHPVGDRQHARCSRGEADQREHVELEGRREPWRVLEEQLTQRVSGVGERVEQGQRLEYLR